MIYQRLFKGIERFGATRTSIAEMAFKCEPGRITETVILAPVWEPTIFSAHTDSIIPIVENSIRRLYEISANGEKITFLRTGPGAPSVAHAVFALSCTPCKNVIFAGSVGGLVDGQDVGDIVVPEYSVCGEGASRYITEGNLKDSDCFGEKYYPNQDIYKNLIAAAKVVTSGNKAALHIGKTFSVDNIFAEFAHLEEILQMGCDSIEMETSLFFKAAEVSGLKAGAVFLISDNSFGGKAIYTARDQADKDSREFSRDHIIPRIILETVKNT
ncbi:phosphorylase family protein [Treponema primitia ZAS-2]|uniref:Uridine phosphorylase n=1 Tax=Treponema primitia (strain ATCC BAA-887 / DSM 12427 / ZAS-2) TaxID=545694 RepID=F5YK08_TREPZ|nr:phosphorylase family protein [Treponema primitia]AEF84210.1 phosphorylase family protein [Treponema primitia ZAS-2]